MSARPAGRHSAAPRLRRTTLALAEAWQRRSGRAGRCRRCRVASGFFDASTGSFVNEVESNETGGNCVANQRTIPANFVLPVGSFDVIASFIPWEAPNTVRSVNMGTLTT